MEEDESFDEFYAKLKDVVNSVFNLGETILEPKIVGNWRNSIDRVGWQSADLWVGFDKDREIEQEQEHGIEGQEQWY